MTATELSKIERAITLRAPRSRVWKAITSRDDFANWFGVKIKGESGFAPGARLEMTSIHEGDGYGTVFFMLIDRIEPEHLISWRWHPGMPELDVDYSKEPMTLVEFKLDEVEGGTRVTVIESGFDQFSLARREKVYGDNSQGWAFQMESLAKYVAESA